MKLASIKNYIQQLPVTVKWSIHNENTQTARDTKQMHKIRLSGQNLRYIYRGKTSIINSGG